METTRKEGSLYTRFSGSLAIVEFGHPASNSLNAELLRRLCAEMASLGSNDQVSVILIQSEGDRAFCAGASFDELLQVKTPEESALFFSGFAKLINALRNCPKPVVCRVHGKAVGGGVGLIAACDYVLASEAASLRLSEEEKIGDCLKLRPRASPRPLRRQLVRRRRRQQRQLRLEPRHHHILMPVAS